MGKTKARQGYFTTLFKFIICRLVHFGHWHYSKWGKNYICTCPLCEKIWKVTKRDFDNHTFKYRKDTFDF